MIDHIVRPFAQFGCLTTWAQKSRKCPLCSTKMAPFVLHHLDEQTGPLKFHLPPLPSSPRLLAAASPTANIISQTTVRPSSSNQTTTDLWAQVRSRQAVDDADELERQVENRRQIYRRRWFVKVCLGRTLEVEQKDETADR